MQNRDNLPTQSGTWIWQALTGVVLVILLSLHMIVQHFVVEGGLRDFEEVLNYIGNPIVLAIEILFLVVVTYHALVGVRSILFDLEMSDQSKKRITRVLTILGLIMGAWGIFLALALYRMAA